MFFPWCFWQLPDFTCITATFQSDLQYLLSIVTIKWTPELAIRPQEEGKVFIKSKIVLLFSVKPLKISKHYSSHLQLSFCIYKFMERKDDHQPCGHFSCQHLTWKMKQMNDFYRHAAACFVSCRRLIKVFRITRLSFIVHRNSHLVYQPHPLLGFLKKLQTLSCRDIFTIAHRCDV